MIYQLIYHEEFFSARECSDSIFHVDVWMKDGKAETKDSSRPYSMHEPERMRQLFLGGRASNRSYRSLS